MSIKLIKRVPAEGPSAIADAEAGKSPQHRRVLWCVSAGHLWENYGKNYKAG